MIPQSSGVLARTVMGRNGPVDRGHFDPVEVVLHNGLAVKMVSFENGSSSSSLFASFGSI